MLPYDYFRCPGQQLETCPSCARMLHPGNPFRQSYMLPPPTEDKCEYYINVNLWGRENEYVSKQL